jgi:hypothetical protein
MGSHPHPEGTRRCRSRACRAPVFFARTVKGARVPLDAAPAGDDVPSQHTYWLDGEGVAHPLGKGEAAPDGKPRYLSHFRTCPDAGRFSRV